MFDYSLSLERYFLFYDKLKEKGGDMRDLEIDFETPIQKKYYSPPIEEPTKAIDSSVMAEQLRGKVLNYKEQTQKYHKEVERLLYENLPDYGIDTPLSQGPVEQMKKRCPEAFLAVDLWCQNMINYGTSFDQLKNKRSDLTGLEIDERFLVSPVFLHLHRDNRKYISPPIQNPTVILFESHGLKHPYCR